MRVVTLVLFFSLAATAQTGYQPTPANLEARRWFQEARFGMFIHWGVYSVLENGEWVMNNTKMPVAEYEKLAPQFNPTEFNAAEWVALAKAAGMKYITITSKHHDGFAMFQTAQTPWNIADATPYKKDVLKMLAEECRKQGIKLFFYHSQLDWHHPDYFPLGRTGQTAGRPAGGDWQRFERIQRREDGGRGVSFTRGHAGCGHAESGPRYGDQPQRNLDDRDQHQL